MKNILNKKTLIFLIIYVLCFCYSFFISKVYNDEIWNYGFAYNISIGLIPYKDFNLITTPLYSFLASIFIKIFGSYLYSFHIFNSIVLSGIIYFFYRKLKLKSLIIIPFIFLNCYPGYNILSVLLILIIINLLDKEIKYKDYIIGIIIGLMFLTKQTIGICLFIPYMFYSKNKIKSFISYLIPIATFLLYLIFNNALYEFINYCFLGLLDFGNSNSILLFLPIEIIICSILVYKLIKSKLKNKTIFYLLMYQVIVIPIFDDYHFMIGFIPIFYYFLNTINIKKYQIKYYIIISLFFFYCWNFLIHPPDKINLYSNKESYLYGRNIPSYININKISNYINLNKKKYAHIYIFSRNAYYIKLNTSYKLDKYDMINDGNMGYKGAEKYLKEINKYCKNKKCMFILYKYEFDDTITQTNKKIVNYTKKNYTKKETIQWFDIYTNDKKEEVYE